MNLNWKCSLSVIGFHHFLPPIENTSDVGFQVPGTSTSYGRILYNVCRKNNYSILFLIFSFVPTERPTNKCLLAC